MDPDAAPIGDWLHQGTSDPREVAERYDEWAQNYDDDLASWSYQGPSVVAETVVTRHPDARSVLDVGCGTGLVGQALRARGFGGQIFGLDISQASLEIARQRGVYDSLERADLQQRLAVEDDSVDAVVCVGVMTYLPDVEAVWREFARVARPGGLVVTTQREDLWDARECPAVIDRLQSEGVWTPLQITGPAPYLPDGYGGTPEVRSYYLTARVTRPSDASQGGGTGGNERTSGP
jgi:ubiquinone/menaquinone biosynthesis C-methylase UbiE